MVKVNIMSKQRWNLSEGKALFEQWQQSGLDKKSFCDEYNINYGRFLYWNQRVNQSENKPVSQTGFVELNLAPESPTESIVVKGGNGLSLYVPNTAASVQFIKALLTA